MTMFVKPAAGHRVYDPATRQPLPPEGSEVPRNQYWLRRLRDGDVIIVSAKRSSKKPAAE